MATSASSGFAAADQAGADRALELIAGASPAAAARLMSDRRLRAVVSVVTAASPWLTRICVAHPDDALAVLGDLDAGGGGVGTGTRTVTGEPGAGTDRAGPRVRLARTKALGVLRIAARDLLGLDDLDAVCANLTGLASGLLQAALDEAAAPALGPPGGGGLAVIGMGKLGAGELNYASDVDLLLVAGEPTGAGGGVAGAGLASLVESRVDRALATSTRLSTDGFPPDPRPFLDLARSAWKVDLDLRPEGRSGALVRTLASFQAYWRRWAEVWEFQALIKARPVAGDPDLGRAFAEAVAEQLWSRPIRADDLRRLRELKARSEQQLSRRGVADREIKRGPGGIRDIEFSLQLLQLVHGHADPALRVPSTLEAIGALAGGGYVAADDAAALETAYRFLRTVEHRLQLYEGSQVHTVPSSPERQEHLARVLGYRPRRRSTAAAQMEADLRRHRRAVRAIHERLFFRPLLEVFGRSVPASGAPAGGAPAGGTPERGPGQGPVPGPLAEEAAKTRLAAFGFTDATRTRQAVLELTRGFSRVSRLMQQMLPLLLDWLSSAPDPDVGLLGLRTLAGERLSRDRLVSVCRESPVGARQLCRLLGTAGRFARDFQRYPDALGELADGSFFRRPAREELDQRIERTLAWRSGEGALELGLRSFAQAERLRIAGNDVLDIDDPGPALSDVADAVVAAALHRVEAEVPLAVVGMGRLGGRELGHGSDLDLLFVHDVPQGAKPDEVAAAAEAAVASFVKMVGGATPATGAYRIDLSLRPEGRQGPAVRSIDSYAAYYERWAEPWERQALLRGRFVAGDRALGTRFAELAGRFVWGRPLRRSEVVEIRRMKARMERERVPAGEDPKFHLKLGPGSLSDVEWTVQMLQLQHGVGSEGTLAALRALAEEGAVTASDRAVLEDAYRFCERTRNRLNLIRDFPSDSLPATGPQMTVLARSLEYSPSELRNEYARRTRRARRVVERLFYGKEDA